MPLSSLFTVGIYVVRHLLPTKYEGSMVRRPQSPEVSARLSVSTTPLWCCRQKGGRNPPTPTPSGSFCPTKAWETRLQTSIFVTLLTTVRVLNMNVNSLLFNNSTALGAGPYRSTSRSCRRFLPTTKATSTHALGWRSCTTVARRVETCAYVRPALHLPDNSLDKHTREKTYSTQKR